MTHEEMSDMYEFYALGLLEPEEQVEIDAHVRQGCEICKVGIRRAVATNSALLTLAPDVAPPRRLRARVLGSFGVQRQSWGWMAIWATATAGLLIATLWYSTEAQRTGSELATARRELTQSHSELTRVQAVMEFLNSPDTRQVTFGKGQQQPPRGNVLFNPHSGVLLIASNLPPLAPGKIYEMWVIPKGVAPRAAGLFRSDQQGNAVHLERGPVDPTSTIAVTVEPEAGVAAPTSAPIFAAPLAGT